MSSFAAAAAAPSGGESGRPSWLIDRTQNEASARGNNAGKRNPASSHQRQQRMLGHARPASPSPSSSAAAAADKPASPSNHPLHRTWLQQLCGQRRGGGHRDGLWRLSFCGLPEGWGLTKERSLLCGLRLRGSHDKWHLRHQQAGRELLWRLAGRGSRARPASQAAAGNRHHSSSKRHTKQQQRRGWQQRWQQSGRGRHKAAEAGGRRSPAQPSPELLALSFMSSTQLPTTSLILAK